VEGKQGKVFTYVIYSFPHKTLDRENGVLRFLNELLLGRISDEYFSTFIKINHRRNQRVAVGTRNDARRAILDDGDEAVRCSKVYSNNLRHYQSFERGLKPATTCLPQCCCEPRSRGL